MKVRVGTATDSNGKERRCAWVETAIKLEPEVHDLVDGLGSKYVRNEATEDNELAGDRPKDLPESITQRDILKVYRDQILYYGESGMGMWGDEMSAERRMACEKWLVDVVTDAFPEMRGYLA